MMAQELEAEVDFESLKLVNCRGCKKPLTTRETEGVLSKRIGRRRKDFPHATVHRRCDRGWSWCRRCAEQLVPTPEEVS